MRLVVIESPLLAPTPEGREYNRQYARACMRHSLARGEAPFASHLLYDQPGILDDMVPIEREHGIEVGFALAEKADLRAIYMDLGCSDGMLRGIKEANNIGQEIEYRYLHGEWRSAK